MCKKNKCITIFNKYSNDGEIILQYIGDDTAVYPVIGLPTFDKNSILTIFDVPEKQRENWTVKIYTQLPENANFDDFDKNERPVDSNEFLIEYLGKKLKPLYTRQGLVFIEVRYLTPVSDVLDVLELYERLTPSGRSYIVAKAGLLLQAVIMPYDIIDYQFVKHLKKLTEQCTVSLNLRKHEVERSTTAEPKQCSLNFDTETGKIIRYEEGIEV